MRGLIPGAPSRVHLAAGLPALLADDPFAQRLTAALDEVGAPLVGALDNLPAYLDPGLAPPDFLRWLAAWVGAEQDADVDRLRDLVSGAVGLHGARGTPGGVRTDIAVRTGLPVQAVEVADSGGVSWSRTARSQPPGSPEPGVRVRLPAGVPRDALAAVLAAAVPAHLPVHVDLLDPPDGSPPTAGAHPAGPGPAGVQTAGDQTAGDLHKDFP